MPTKNVSKRLRNSRWRVMGELKHSIVRYNAGYAVKKTDSNGAPSSRALMTSVSAYAKHLICAWFRSSLGSSLSLQMMIKITGEGPSATGKLKRKELTLKHQFSFMIHKLIWL